MLEDALEAEVAMARSQATKLEERVRELEERAPEKAVTFDENLKMDLGMRARRMTEALEALRRSTCAVGGPEVNCRFCCFGDSLAVRR